MTEKKRRLSKKKRLELINEHIPIAWYVANKIAPQISNRSSMANHIDHDDLYSAAMIGLVNAAKKYDPSKGCLFSTFSRHYIRGAVLDELRAHDMLTRVMRDKYRKLEKTLEMLEHRLGRQPIDEEVARELNISIEDYYNMTNELSLLPALSLDDHWEDSSGDIICIGDILTDEKIRDPQNISIQKQAIYRVMTALNMISDLNKLYFLLHYVEGLTLKEIGELFSLHESRISQIITQTTGIIRESISTTYT